MPRARKRFGQHFLHASDVIHRIVDSVSPQPGDQLVEIGPGRGAITGLLLARGAELDVVELDRDLIPGLIDLAAKSDGRLRVHQGDALEFDLCGCRRRTAVRVVGNLPYNISTPLLFHFLAQRHCVADMHFMLQREVVDRMTAAPGNREYGRLSVMLQLHCKVERLFRIGPGAFTPPPKVESAFVRLVPYDHPPVAVADTEVFALIVRQAFAQRRKTLRNSLRETLTADDFSSAEIDPGLRAEQLRLEDFARLANRAAAIRQY